MADDNQGSQSTGDQTGDNNSSSQDTQPKWTDQLPENLRGDEKLTRFEKVGDLGKAYIDLEGKYRPDAVLIPGDDATDEDRTTFFNKLGRPDAPEGYEFADYKWPDGIDEIIKTVAKQDVEAFRPVMHKLGLNKVQADTLMNKYIEVGVEQWKKSKDEAIANQNKVKEDLQKEWGGNYKESLEVAKRGYEKAGELAGIKDEFSDFMEKVGFGDNPLFIKVFHAIGKAILDDSALERKQTGDPREDESGELKLHFPSMEGKK